MKNSNSTSSQEPSEIRLLKGILNKKESIPSIRSSQFSEGVADVAKDYLIGIFDKATRIIINDSEEEIRMLDENEIVFTREVTEESLQSDSNYLIFIF